MGVNDDDKLATGRLRRTAKVGSVMGTEGAKYARTKAANVVRGQQKRDAALEQRHAEAAERMADVLGNLRGAAMKFAQLASFVDTELIPDEYRGVYQEKLGTLRSDAPSMPFEKVRSVLEDAFEDPLEEIFEDFEHEARAAASIGQVHRAVLADGREVAVKVQYPGMAKALAADMQNAGLIMRLAKALAPGLDAKAAAAELKERVLEELDYELEAANQRTFARAYKGHPFIYVPNVVAGLSTERVLVTEWVDQGAGFDDVKTRSQAERDRFGEIVFRFHFGSIYHLLHFNADAHPGNYLAMPDGRVAFLDFGMTKRLEHKQVELEIAAVTAALENDPERVRETLADIGYLRKPERMDAEALMAQVMAVGGWYLQDAEVTVDSTRVMEALTAMTDPRSEHYALMRRQNVPADELMGQRMQTGVLAVLGQLNATRNWCAIGREWWFADDPATELGEDEWAFFEAKGEKRTAKFRTRFT